MRNNFPTFTEIKLNIMASRKELKKSIHNISDELISECLTYRHYHPDVPEQKIDEIISLIITHRNEYLARANKPDGKDSRELVKKHYRAIFEDIRNKTIPLLDQLESK
jgi:hypothetical protein